MQQKENSSRSQETSGESYNAFAEIYDEVMDAVPYDYWFDYMKFLWKYHRDHPPQKILELACGTGSMMKRFVGQNYLIDGLDKSASMLEQAKNKLAGEGFSGQVYCQDMREFSLDKKYDLIYSIFDSMNYILTLEDLELVFKQVYQHLTDKGLFIFDFNTRARLQEIEPGLKNFHGKDFDCQWRDIVDEKNNLWQVKLTINLADQPGFFHEQHKETSFALTKIDRALQKAGFKFNCCYDGNSLRKGREASSRVYFVAGKEKFAGHSFLNRLQFKLGWKLNQLKYFFNFK